MALATLARGSWVDLAEIESPTDSDIPFGAPARRHARDIFTFEETRHLWHYTRSDKGWVARSIPLRDGSVQLVAPHMALDARGLVVANENAAGEPVLLVFGRDELGRTLEPTTNGLPARVEGMAFGGAMLYLGFGRPDPVGAVIWAVSLPQTGRLAPVRRFSVPAPDNAAFTHVAGLDASADWLLVLQLDAAWVASTSGTTPLRRLELPASRAGLRRPTGVVVGSQAVVIVGDMFGTFALDE